MPGPALLADALGLYLHVPFCSHICPYCDFNTYAGQESLIDRYVTALAVEIRMRGETLPMRDAATIFFGGGTPSLLSPSHIDHVLTTCAEAFTMQDGAEVTLEANPNGLTTDYLANIRAAGVNRLSLGGQTFSRRGLRTLGRLHNPDDIRQAIVSANAAGFSNISLDLIFGWPGQTVESWEADLDELISRGSPGILLSHLSLYGLIVEPGTPMAAAVERGVLALPSDDAGATMYEVAIERLAAAGWVHYEVANWAREASLGSRHNQIYWRNGDYLGAGAGAYGTVGGSRWMNHLLPTTYIATVLDRDVLPVSNVEIIDERTAMGETMMLGLRMLQAGVSPANFQKRHNRDIDQQFGAELTTLQEMGMLHRDAEGIRLTPRGLMLANDVCARFL